MEVSTMNLIISSAISGIVAGVAAVSVIRIELKYLRRDVDSAHKRLDKYEDKKSRG